MSQLDWFISILGVSVVDMVSRVFIILSLYIRHKQYNYKIPGALKYPELLESALKQQAWWRIYVSCTGSSLLQNTKPDLQENA